MESTDHTRDDWITLFIAYCEKNQLGHAHEPLLESAQRLYRPGTTPLQAVLRLRFEALDRGDSD